MAVVVPAVLWIYRSRVPTNVAYVSEEDGAISVLDLKTLSVVRRVQPQEVAPRGLAVTADGRYLITSNKNTKDATVFSTPELRLVRRIDLGSSPEFLKVNPSGDRIFATFEPSSTGGPGKPPAIGDTDDDTNGPALPARQVSRVQVGVVLEFLDRFDHAGPRGGLHHGGIVQHPGHGCGGHLGAPGYLFQIHRPNIVQGILRFDR